MSRKALSEQEALQADLLIRFMDVCSKGLVRPYDPTPIVEKLESLRQQGFNVEKLQECCPPVGDVHDVKDLKPYIMGCAEELAQILQVKKVSQDGYNSRGSR